MEKDKYREIIEDFANDIDQAKSKKGPMPEEIVIDFRDNKKTNTPSTVYTVPISLLRFRKENGRIASDVASYEKAHGVLREDNANDQKILAGFLKAKDPETTEILKKAIKQKGQEEPAIITADGFLINGNRRRLVLEMLLEETSDSSYERMKVVILPGKKDDGGAPTIREIEQIENRYQLQKDGKSEYSNFDRALSIRRKMRAGMSLEDQLRDDPVTSGMSPKEFKKELQRYEEEFLKPLECVDRYLSWLGKEEMYTLISAGRGDRENRWQAFIDYQKFYKRLLDPEERMKLGVEEKEVYKIETMAFNLIRLRDFSQIGLKLYTLIRSLPKYVKDQIAKKELLEIVPLVNKTPVPEDEDKSEDGDSEKRWANANQAAIRRQVYKAKETLEHKGMMEKPLDLLRQSLDKLNHDGMDVGAVKFGDLTEALHIAENIERRAKELKNEFYQTKKNSDANLEKFNRSK